MNQAAAAEIPVDVRSKAHYEQLRHWADEVLAASEDNHPQAARLLAVSLGLTFVADELAPSPEHPAYSKVEHESGWAVWVDEGWRRTCLAENLDEWVADFLVRSLQGRPFDRRGR